MEPNTGIKTWQWVVTLIVIIILIIIGIIVFGGDKSTNPGESPLPVGSESPVAGVNMITMTDQYPGNVVYISSVQAAQPSWVVIQKDNNGQPGAVIGSSKFNTGVNPGGRVSLTQPTIEGGTYYAVMYIDDGSGTFNATTATPVKNANGDIVMKVFRASASASAGIKG